jgi:hypothetical protein
MSYFSTQMSCLVQRSSNFLICITTKCIRLNLNHSWSTFFPLLKLFSDAVLSTLNARLSSKRRSVCSLISTHLTVNGLPEGSSPIMLALRCISLLSLFWKNKVGLWDHVAVCVCVSPLLTFKRLNQSLWNLVSMSWHLSPSQRSNKKIPHISLCVCMCISLSLPGNCSVKIPLSPPGNGSVKIPLSLLGNGSVETLPR